MVICDSSTLIHLSAIGRLRLLFDFYGTVIIPGAVWQEVVQEGEDRPGAKEVEEAIQEGRIEVRKVSGESLVRSLKQDLDRGEAEVIALAVENQAQLVLLDETEARRIAGVFELQKTGIIGLLIRAKAEGKIEDLRAELDRLRTQGGFWIEERLYRRVLEAAGEES